MKKITSIICSIAAFTAAALTVTSCVDKNDWETDNSYDRLFSIIKMSVSAGTTTAEYTFTANSRAEYYIVELSKDSLYDAIEMGQHESSIVYGEDKSITRSPIMLEDLDSDSKYFLRVKAMSSKVTNSNWSYLTDRSFKTRAEQIITNVIAGVTSATVQWPAGSKATHITLFDGTATNSRNLTSDEIAAGEVIITGLTSSTSYTVKLMNGNTTRGSKTFNTLMDLGGATPINPGDDIKTILEGASAGEVYAVMPGTYEVAAKVTLSQSITVRAAIPGEAIINGMSFDMKAGVGLELKDLTLNGADATGQLINYTEEYTAGETAALTVTGCDIRNYASGFINQRVIIAVSSMTITGNFFNNVGASSGRFIDIQRGYAKEINLSENTLANSCSGADVIRIDNSAGSFTGVSSVITINRNTLYKTGNGASLRLIYTRLAGHTISLSKNLITNSAGYYSDQSSTVVSAMTNNYYHEAANYLAAGGKRVSDANGTVVNPEFKDPDNLDFTVQSNAVLTAGAGDPRWLN